MFCHSVQEKVENPPTWDCHLLWPYSQITCQPRLFSWWTDSIWCTVWHVTRRLHCLHLALFDMWHEHKQGCLQNLSGYVLSINYSSVRMKGKPRKKHWCQIQQRKEYAFNIKSEVWTADTVYVQMSMCPWARHWTPNCSRWLASAPHKAQIAAIDVWVCA